MTVPTRPAYQKYDVAVHKSGIDGFGAFAAEPMPKHRKIGEIRGESISVSEARRRAIGKQRIMIVEVSARKALDAAGVAHHDLDYGSYFSMWRQRNALKLWSGWPTFPMVFVKGTLVGGANDLDKLIASGELKKLLA